MILLIEATSVCILKQNNDPIIHYLVIIYLLVVLPATIFISFHLFVISQSQEVYCSKVRLG